jgi:8-oxo-dGTP diphosphatase
MDYVVGFAFDGLDLPDTHVLLIRKKKPDWQRGKLNGIGGKIGDKPSISNETPIQAMVREFHEETGVTNFPGDWSYFALMHNGLYEHQVYCFESRNPYLFHEARTMEAEELVRIPVHGVIFPRLYNLIPNLRSKLLIACDRESWHRPTEFIYGGEHFAGKDLKAAVAADPKVEL